MLNAGVGGWGWRVRGEERLMGESVGVGWWEGDKFGFPSLVSWLIGVGEGTLSVLPELLNAVTKTFINMQILSGNLDPVGLC